MDTWEVLTVVALVLVAVAAGGAVVRLGSTLGTTPVLVTTLLVAALVLAVVLGTAWSLRRGSTPYW